MYLFMNNSNNLYDTNKNALKKERVGWYFYDFANSAFPTIVVTLFLGPYLTEIAANAANIDGTVKFFFWNISSGSYFPFIISLSIILQLLFLPFVGTLADTSKYKKHILFISAYIGAISTACLFFVSGTNYMLGGCLFIIANLNFGVSCVVYNSYLSYISGTKSKETVSSMGWAYGYIGGGILLIINLFLYLNANKYGISNEYAVRICLASAGIWWGIFSLIPLFTINKKRGINADNTIKNKKLVSKTIISFIDTVKDCTKYPQTILFLICYTFYNDGVQAVIALSAQFGNKEIGLSMDVLIIVILLIQFVAFIGSLLFGYIAKKTNSIISLRISIIIWLFVIIYAFLFLYSELDFYIMGIIVGLVLGGTQAISRSIFSQIIPYGKEAEYFSVYEISEKGTSWLAPFVFGIVYNFTFSYRYAILSLLVFFIIGFVLLTKFNFVKGKNAIMNSNIN